MRPQAGVSERSSDLFSPRSPLARRPTKARILPGPLISFLLFSPVTQTVEQPSRPPCPHSWGHVCSRVSLPIPPRRRRGMSSPLACDCHSRNFAERDAANLGTDPGVPRRRFCAAWTPGSVPGFTHGARIAAARGNPGGSPGKPVTANPDFFSPSPQPLDRLPHRNAPARMLA